jgi:solute carrier family 25 (mitochondrial S-adenosylmethionine transporter), member 26
LPGDTALPTPLVHSLASGTAELASCLVLTPAEVIKQNAQMIRSSGGSSPGRSGGWKNSTSIQALRKLAGPEDTGGPARRLLTGYTALVARNLPFTALQFPIFEALRQRIWQSRDRRSDSIQTVKDGQAGVEGGERKVEQGVMARGLLETGLVNGISAATSGAMAAVVTSPADTVKTRMMLLAGEERQQQVRFEEQEQRKASGQMRLRETQKQLDSAVRRHGMNGMQVARLIYQERGVYGLFRGGLLRAAWTALGSGLYLGTYEVAKVWLKGSSGAGDTDDDTL